MKKILGVSIMAMLVVTPMMANASMNHASTVPVGNETGANATVDAAVATAGYVKGAYNAAIGEINSVIDVVNSLSTTVDGLSGSNGGIAGAIEQNAQNATFTPAANSSIEDADTIAEAIEEVSSHVDTLSDAVSANTSAIQTLNGGANDAGSVANTAAAAVQSGAANADFTPASGSSITTADTIAEAIEEVSGHVDTLAAKQINYVDTWGATTTKSKTLNQLPL